MRWCLNYWPFTNTGLEQWTGLVDWTGGLTLKIIFTLSNKTHFSLENCVPPPTRSTIKHIANHTAMPGISSP